MVPEQKGSLFLLKHVHFFVQILNSVKAKVESNLSQLDNLEQPLLLAKENLIEREETRTRSVSRKMSQPASPKSSQNRTSPARRSSSNSPARISTPDVPSPYRNTFVSGRKDSIVESSDASSSEQNLENAIEQASSWILLNLGPKGISRERTRAKHINMIKNTVYCAVLMEEWMKELAAISLEHAVQPYAEIDVTF